MFVQYALGLFPYSYTLPPLGSGEAIGEKAIDMFGRGAVTGGFVGMLYGCGLQSYKLKSPRILHVSKIMVRHSLWNAVIFSAASITVNLLARYRGRDTPAAWGVGAAQVGLSWQIMSGTLTRLWLPVVFFGFTSGFYFRLADVTVAPGYTHLVHVSSDCSRHPPPNGLSLQGRMYWEKTRWQGRLPETATELSN